MSGTKKTYYVSVASRSISQLSESSPWEFSIEATDSDVLQLREYFDRASDADWQSFWRSHVPYVQYHNDKPNDMYDSGIQKAYELIHELGNNDAKQHIETMGIVDYEG